MKKIFLATYLVLFVLSAYSAEQKLFWLYSTNKKEKPVSLSLVAAQSIPYFANIIEAHEQGAINKEFQMPLECIFINATHNNLQHLKEYSIRRHQMAEETRKHKATGDIAPLTHKAEKALYDYAIQLPDQEVEKLTSYACKIFPKEDIPHGLLQPLLYKISLKKGIAWQKSYFNESTTKVLQDAWQNVVAKTAVNNDLLKKVISRDDRNGNIISCLFGAYNKVSNKMIHLPSPSQAIARLFLGEKIDYVYVSDNMTVCLRASGAASPRGVNELIIYKDGQTKSFQSWNICSDVLSFKDNIVCNKAKTLLACPYDSLNKDSGIFIVNTETWQTNNITISGKPAIFCLDSYNQILVCDGDGIIWNLSERNREKSFNTQCKEIKGLISDDVNNTFIFWDRNMVAIRQKNVSNPNPYFNLKEWDDKASVMDVAMDCTGTKLCVRTFTRGVLSNESFFQYWLFLLDYTECTHSSRQLCQLSAEKTLMSFSPDGNILTISSCNRGITVHQSFAVCFSDPVLLSWCEQTEGELLAADNGKIVGQKESHFYSEPKPYVMNLVDQNMADALPLLTQQNFAPYAVQALEINNALFKRFTTDDEDKYNYPSEIMRLLTPTNKEAKNITIENADNYWIWKSLCGKIYEYRGVFAGILMASIYGLWKKLHQAA